jgi:hypothetical protein
MGHYYIQNNNISCVANLPQLGSWNGSIANNPLSCVPNQSNYNLNSGGNPLPLCIEGDTVNNPNNCQSAAQILGFVFTDLNSNCYYENTDINLNNIPVKLYTTQTF